MVQPAVPGGGAAPPASTPAELTALLRGDPSLAELRVIGEGEDHVELALPDGGFVLVWPTLWTDRARLQTHLVRARSGYLPILLLGTDEEFARHDVSSLCNEGDVSATPLPIGRERVRMAIRG